MSLPLQLSFFDAPPASYAAVPVRSHVRRVKSAHPAPVQRERSTARHQAPHNGTTTSKQAADALTDSGIATSQYARVVACVRQSGAQGLTREEIAQQVGIRLSAVCGRVNEAIKNGLLFEEGTRKSVEGFAQKVVKAR